MKRRGIRVHCYILPVIAFIIAQTAVLPESCQLAFGQNAGPYTIAIARTEWSNADLDRRIGLLIEVLTRVNHGTAPAVLDASSLMDAATVTPSRIDLLVLPDTGSVPASIGLNVLDYMESGGRILTFGGVLFETVLIKSGPGWIPISEALDRLTPEHVIENFADEASLSRWERASHKPGTLGEVRRIDGPAGSGGAMEIRTVFDAEKVWETRMLAALPAPIPGGHHLTSLWVKGGGNTVGMGLEWREKDGSRWIAPVALTAEWRHVVLTEADFKFWNDNSPAGRGQAGDQLNLKNAASLSILLAKSHGDIADGEHAFAVANLGTAPPPYDAEKVKRLAAPVECYRPIYKMHVLGGIDALRDWHSEAGGLWEDWNNPPSRLHCAIPRPRGQGMAGEETARWEPLLECRGEGRGTGSFAWRLIHHAGKFKGGVWANIGVPVEYNLNNIERLARLVERVAGKALAPAVLTRAGSREAAVFRGESVRCGAEVAALGGRTPGRINLSLKIRQSDDAALLERSVALSLAAHEKSAVEFEWSPGDAPQGTYSLFAQLKDDKGEVLDALEAPFSVLDVANDPPEDFVVARDGKFWLGEERWAIHGINFWPRYVSGREVANYNLGWLRPGIYDPEYVERDLNILNSLGINLVSVQILDPDDARSAADFLFRCRRHGIRANLFIPEMFPVVKNSAAPNKWREIIQAARLGNNSTVFAWDVGWEPHLGFEEARRQWDSEWRDWLIEQYGSPEAAEKDWGWPLRRRGDLPTGPADEQIVADGEWRPLVAAYRRFADDLISRHYGRRLREVRAVAPNALFGMRTGWGGTGTEWAQRGFQYDLASGAIHLDFISPEAWGYAPSAMWEAGIMAAYGRMVSGGKPIFWSEFGQEITLAPGAAKIELQRATYAALFDMAIQTRSNGTAGWWFPGGYRLGENSDYGIVDPSGALRPSARIVRENAGRIMAATATFSPDEWITVDRDADARGMYGIRVAARDQYNSLSGAGRLPGLKTAGTGTDSASCPLTAIGNRPFNGSNPPKYLNSEFITVAVQGPAGNWREVAANDRVARSPSGDLLLHARIGNTGDAAWLSVGSAAGRPGAVYLVCELSGGTEQRWPVGADVAFLGMAVFPTITIALPEGAPETTLRLRMEAEGRCRFGQEIRLTVE